MIHARPDGSFTLYVPYCVNSTYSCVQPVLQLYVIHEISQNNTVSIRTKHSRLSRSSFPRNILANIGRCGACGRVRERAESGIAAIGETHARIGCCHPRFSLDVDRNAPCSPVAPQRATQAASRVRPYRHSRVTHCMCWTFDSLGVGDATLVAAAPRPRTQATEF